VAPIAAKMGMLRIVAFIIVVREDVGMAVYVTGRGPTVIVPAQAAMMRMDVDVADRTLPPMDGFVNATMGQVPPGMATAVKTLLKTQVSKMSEPDCLTIAVVVCGMIAAQLDMSKKMFLKDTTAVVDLIANAAQVR